MKKYRWYLLAFFFCSGNLIRAQEVPRVVSFDKNQYQAYNQNWAITQTPEGLMYFANSAGLLEYDGQYWQTYPLPDKQILRSVATDGKGKIFGGGYGEFGYWEADPQGCLQYHSLRSGLEQSAAESEEIWNIVMDSQLVLFQSFSEVYAYDYQQVYQIEDPGLLLFIKKIGDRWIFPLIGNELQAWTPDSGFTPLTTTPSLASFRIKALTPKPTGGFWVATERNGIFQFDREDQFTRRPTEIDEALKDFQINRMVLLRSGNIAVGTILNGLYVLDQAGKLIYHLNKESGLQDNTVLGLLEDDTGNLWVALDKGIDLVMTSEALKFHTDITGKLGTIYDALLYQDLLYVGTNHGLYVRPYQSRADFSLVEGTQGQVWDLSVHNRRLLCGHNNGTFQVEEENIRQVSDINGGWYTQPFPGRDDLLLQSTYIGFILLRKDPEGWKFDRRISGFQVPIKKFYFDEQGYLWALHNTEGLWQVRFNEQLDSVSYIREVDERDGLPTTFGLNMVQIDEQLIIRAGNSLFQWDTSQQKLLPLESFAGNPIPSQRMTLLPGSQQDWFMATLNQLSWFRADSLVRDFSLQLVPNFEQVVALDSTTYLFCLDNGFALLNHRESLPPLPKRPPPIISKIEVIRPNYRQLRPFRSSFPADEALAFGPHERQIRFSFALPYFGEPVNYRYRIRNYDNQWSTWSSLTVIEINRLKAGTYVFELEADRGAGITRQAFRVLPQWYETVWAKTGYVLSALLALFLLWRWHQRRLRKQFQDLEDQKEKQLLEERIKTKNEQLQQDVLRKSRELANSTFNLVRKNEILIQLKEALGTKNPAHNRQLIRLIDRHLTDEEDWKIFETNFNQVHEVFFKKLKNEYPELTPGDLRLAAYLKMNLTSKEIAPLFNISLRGVENKRYRLRRKMELDSDQNLTDFLMQY